MSRTPTHVLKSPHNIKHKGDYIVLGAGTFVRPIHLSYVPKHVIDDTQNVYHNPDTEIFCYTRFGIISIPKELIRET